MQLGYWYRKYDQTGKYVYPSERHVIKKYKNSYGDVVKIYDTDEERTLDEVYNEYYMYRDIVDMLDVAQENKNTWGETYRQISQASIWRQNIRSNLAP